MWETFHRVRNFEITLSHEEKSLWSHVGKTCERVSVHVCVYALTCNTHLVQHVVWIRHTHDHWPVWTDSKSLSDFTVEVLCVCKSCACLKDVNMSEDLGCTSTSHLWLQHTVCLCACVCADVSYRVVIDHFLEAFATLFKAFLWCRVHSVSMDFHMNVKIFLT